MKKKQKEKLLKAFRPSFENTRQQLFRTLEEKAANLYQLNITVNLNPKNPQELLIENLGETTRDKQLTVPVDDSFVTIIKRIQKQEKNLLDHFTTNLCQEIANYWYVAPKTEETNAAEPTTPVIEKVAPTLAKEATTTEVTETAAAGDELSLADFTSEMENFPKFFVKTTDQEILVKEAAKEDRLLATISTKEEATFTIEKALDRKYKLKTEVIPLIEKFANTPIAKR